MVEIRVKQCGSCPQLQLVKLQTAKGSLRRPVLGPLNTRYQELGSEPQWQELIASRIQSGQITSVNCQLKWQGQYQGHYEDQLWDYSKGLQVHRNKAHLQPHRETQMTSFQKWEKTFCLEAAERQRLSLSQMAQLRFREVQETMLIYSSWSFSCEAFTGGRSKIWLIFSAVLTALWVWKTYQEGQETSVFTKGSLEKEHRAQLYQPEEPARCENQTCCTASLLMLTPVNLGSEVLNSALLFPCLITCPSISTLCSVWKGSSDLCGALQSFQSNRRSFLNNFRDFFPLFAEISHCT